jgi:Holliday junction resolvasome RuvABC endonuclease subunit
MNVLGLDPGMRTGWAVLCDDGTPDVDLLGCGLLTPDDPKLRVPDRIESLCTGLGALLDEYEPGLVVLEWDSGHVNERRHRGGGAGLATHGAVTAALWREVLAWSRSHRATVVTVDESTWTRGVPKGERALAVAASFPYRLQDDPGLDIADAIGIVVWKLKELCVRRNAS